MLASAWFAWPFLAADAQAAPCTPPAPGTIVDGTASFSWTQFGNPGAATYSVASGPNQLTRDWWYYRIEGDPHETLFPMPACADYVADTATLTWVIPTGTTTFIAELVSQVTEGSGGTSSYITHALTITNVGSASILIHIFGHVDLDMTGTSGDDKATLVSAAPRMEVFDGTTSGECQGKAAFSYQAHVATVFPNLTEQLRDGMITNFQNGGLPHGPGDWEAGFQWFADLAPFDSVRFTKVYSIGQRLPEVFSDGFEVGTTSNWSVKVPPPC